MQAIKFEATTNYDIGRNGTKVTHLVIHAMAGLFPGTVTWFKNPKSQVSAHYLISKKGELLQMVQEKNKAWHCGKANAFTIGIELEDGALVLDPKSGKRVLKTCLNDPTWLTSVEFDTATGLAADICKRNGIPVANIIGHYDPMLRKLGATHDDPGPFFDIAKFRKIVQEKMLK